MTPTTGRPPVLLPLLLVALAAACADRGGDAVPAALFRAPPVPDDVDGVRFTAGNWEPHLAAGAKGASWGNHRAVVELGATGEDRGDAVVVTIPWRRPDAEPAKKAVIVVDAASGAPVPNAVALRIDNVSGDIAFEPAPGSSVYHVYYLPWQSTGGYYPTVTYPTPGELRDPAEDSPWAGLVPPPEPRWERRVRAAAPDALPRARATRIESVSDFHSFFPMEVIASPGETTAFLAGAPGGWRLVPEYRDRPVRMRRHLPRHWTLAAPDSVPAFASPVLRGEAFTFQIAVVAGNAPLDDLRVAFEGFPGAWSDAITCFNAGGIDETGRPFSKRIDVPADEVQPLWIGIRVPDDQAPGRVTGTVRVSSANRGAHEIRVALDVGAGRAVAGGEDEPDLQTRLAWLDSKAGSDPDAIVPPFLPVEVEDRALSILGRRVELGPSGLPARIESFFTPDVTGIGPTAAPILARPLALEVRTAGGAVEEFAFAPYDVTRASRGRAAWTARGRSERFAMAVDGALEYDGMLDLRITLVARRDVAVEEIALPVSLDPGAAEYMLGLGRRGGRRPPEVDWRWNVDNHQEGAWLGGVNRGLQWVLRDENYVRPLNTNFYRNQPLRLPPSWWNGGRGGIRIAAEAGGAAVTARNYSGPREVAGGDSLHFQVRFLVTPFKPIEAATHFRTRFVHQYVPVDSVVAWGGTVVNIHHANEINPYINYPFYNLAAQKAYIDEAHEKGVKVKLYNTIREISYRAFELFPLRSLGDEILNDGEGGGHSWLQEHLRSHYHSAWHAWSVDDAAILDKGTSRWTNYYVEGIGWLAERQGIDGLYLDDIAFSRATVKRLSNVLHEHRDEVVIDLHSANQFNERDGFTNSAMLYMEHFPYITRLWFGEYFEYDRGPDYWLTEVSGLPFGLMGEMLQDGGHPYRGLVYGMTARKYGDVDPRPVWRLMDAFGIAESRMSGYWLPDPPVRTGNPEVRATAYARDGAVLLALGSWSDRDEVVRLELDREALGLGTDLRARVPAVEGLQEAGDVDLSAVRVPAGQGLFVLVEPAGA